MSTRSAVPAAVLAAVLALLPASAKAQSNGDGFLFQKPLGSFVLRGGLAATMARGDLYSFLAEQFTLNKGDFRARQMGADLLIRVAPRADLDFGIGFSRSNKDSHFRDFVDLNDQEIEQATSLSRVPTTVGARIYLAPLGRSIGQYAWIPTKVVPYVGAGGGMMWYRFRQTGDFIDFETTDVFPDTFESSGWTPTAHAIAGVDYSLNPRLALNGEARYTWAHAHLSDDFAGFNGIDLSDIGVTFGLNVRF